MTRAETKVFHKVFWTVMLPQLWSHVTILMAWRKSLYTIWKLR